MSYARKMDEMVGAHVSEFQREFSLAKQFRDVKQGPHMPYGYPVAVYNPKHPCKIPAKRKRLLTKTGGYQSNGIPLVLRMVLVRDNILGIHNPPAFA